ncbi:MAG TPA: hypothetical protein VMS89_03920 [Methanoregulaceae archaeon]|nr:hypothetical protein [Methanoregulaceae archaeon]
MSWRSLEWTLLVCILAGGLVTGIAAADTTITLEQGWNLVSIPRTLDSGHSTAGIVFQGVNTGGHSTWEYNAQAQSWVKVYPATMLRPLDGIFIYSTAHTSVPITFTADPVAVPPVKPVYQGWNLIGFSGTTPASAHDTFISLNNLWSQAMGFDAVSQGYETQIISGGGGIFADSRTLYPDKGYWLYVTGPGTLAGIGS